MQFGISIPTSREGKGSKPGTVSPQDLIKLAKVADNLGYDSACSYIYFLVPAWNNAFDTRGIS